MCKLNIKSSFGLSQHEPVAVIVVADVLVVEPGHTLAFVLRVEPALVPADFHVVAVRIVTGDDDGDDIVENLLRFRIILTGEVVCEFERHQAGADFGRVLRAEEESCHPAALHEFFKLLASRCAGVPEAAKCFSQLTSHCEVAWRGDMDRDVGSALCRFAKDFEFNSIRGGCKLFVIGDDVAPGGQLTGSAHRVA